MAKKNKFRQKTTTRLGFIAILSILIFPAKSFAADSTQSKSFVKDILGITNHNFSKASVSIDHNKRKIDITNNSSDNIFCLEISKIKSEWTYHFHNFTRMSFLGNDDPWNLNLKDASKTIDISGNTFTNTDVAISILDSKLFAPPDDATDKQYYSRKASSDQELTEPSNIGLCFTVDRVTYMITGSNSVSYIKTTSIAKKIKIPSSVSYKGVKYKVTAINAYAFKNNRKIKNVTIPKSIIAIEQNAFENCKYLSVIKLNANTIKTIDKNAFRGINKQAKFTIYSKSNKKYKALVRKIKKSTNRKKLEFIMKKKR